MRLNQQMIKMLKTNTAILLIVFCSNLLAFPGGDGTFQEPYQIATVQDLLDVNNDLAAHYILANDVDLSPAVTTLPAFGTALIAPDIDSIDIVFDGAGFKAALMAMATKYLISQLMPAPAIMTIWAFLVR
ncbi:MAG: hypothetical protein JEZ07_10160 [Phycisphaerae bacterium]|nr:hypothetical protein [Phycisphaerae bacterium]